MFPIVEKYETGDIGQLELCEIYGLKVATFNYWLRKYRFESANSGGKFITLEPLQKEGSRYEMEVVTLGGTTFRFNQLVPVGYLSQLLGEL